jgi:hypothetical protein
MNNSSHDEWIQCSHKENIEFAKYLLFNIEWIDEFPNQINCKKS